jgi:selenocysteine lyase/cysteine desulfurase
VRDPDSIRVALPTYWSREAHDPDGTFEPRAGAGRFDTGPIPVPSLAGLETALRLAPDSRFADARAATDRCRALLAQRFDVVTPPGDATLVTFQPPSDAAETVSTLYAAGVVVRDIPETGWVRVSCGYWTTDDHLDRLLAALG